MPTASAEIIIFANPLGYNRAYCGVGSVWVPTKTRCRRTVRRQIFALFRNGAVGLIEDLRGGTFYCTILVSTRGGVKGNRIGSLSVSVCCRFVAGAQGSHSKKRVRRPESVGRAGLALPSGSFGYFCSSWQKYHPRSCATRLSLHSRRKLKKSMCNPSVS